MVLLFVFRWFAPESEKVLHEWIVFSALYEVVINVSNVTVVVLAGISSWWITADAWRILTGLWAVPPQQLLHRSEIPVTFAPMMTTSYSVEKTIHSRNTFSDSTPLRKVAPGTNQ
jgi:hypothetical protein